MRVDMDKGTRDADKFEKQLEDDSRLSLGDQEEEEDQEDDEDIA
jgi:hypothetical protein